MRVSCINWSFELMQINIQILLRSFDNSLNEDVCPTFLQKLNISPKHSDLNDQNLFQFTIDAPPGVLGVPGVPDVSVVF